MLKGMVSLQFDKGNIDDAMKSVKSLILGNPESGY
jgi:hypothetical protein